MTSVSAVGRARGGTGQGTGNGHCGPGRDQRPATRAVHLTSTSMDLPDLDALAALVADGDVVVLSGAGLSTERRPVIHTPR